MAGETGSPAVGAGRSLEAPPGGAGTSEASSLDAVTGAGGPWSGAPPGDEGSVAGVALHAAITAHGSASVGIFRKRLTNELSKRPRLFAWYPERMRSLAKPCSLLFFAVLASACAAAPARMPTAARESARAEEPPPASLAEAESQLDQAYRQLGGTRRGTATGGYPDKENAPQSGGAVLKDKPEASPPPAPPAAEPPKPTTAEGPPRDDRTPKAAGKKDAAAEAQTDEASPCRQACRAYASLRRAVDAVCRMAGDPSDKCSTARDRQKEIEGRITTCGCL